MGGNNGTISRHRQNVLEPEILHWLNKLNLEAGRQRICTIQAGLPLKYVIDDIRHILLDSLP